MIIAAGTAFVYEEPIVRVQKTRYMMDTEVTITVYAQEDGGSKIIDKAFDRMAEIEARASRFINGSDLSSLNRDGSLHNAHPDLFEMISLSEKYWNYTNGFFDITVMPLIDIWENGVNGVYLWEMDNATRQSHIDDALDLVGTDLVDIIGPPTWSIIFTKAGMAVTLDGVAKGYAVEQALMVLKAEGAKWGMINAGGDLATFGGKPTGDPWTIALENPADTNDFIAEFEVDDMAVATSGNYRRFYDENENVGHILNPKTGYTVNMAPDEDPAKKTTSATVITEDAGIADILATAMFVLGPDEGKTIADFISTTEIMELEVLWTYENALGEMEIDHTDGIEKYATVGV